MQLALLPDEAPQRYDNRRLAYAGPRDQAITTPRELFAVLHAEFRFTLDGAASPENALLPRFSAWNAPLSWAGERVFCNPPWSHIRPFIEQAPAADLAVFLVPSRTNVRWFHRALALGAAPRFFRGRPRFGGCSNSPIDCMLLIFGNGPS